MKTKIDSYLKKLNSVGVKSSLFIFQCCLGFLSLSFEELSAEQVESWIKQLNSPRLDRIWLLRNRRKRQSSVLYFVVWHFRDRVIQEREYTREILEKPNNANPTSTKVKEIIDPLSREIHKFSAFDGVEFVGSLIGAWMLSCPQVSILSASKSIPILQPDRVWIKSVFPASLPSDELKLLYRLDHWLYEAFKNWETL